MRSCMTVPVPVPAMTVRCTRGGEHIDVIVTSPPYDIGKDYDKHNVLEDDMIFLWHMRQSSSLCKKVLKPDVQFFLNVGHRTSRTNSERILFYKPQSPGWRWLVLVTKVLVPFVQLFPIAIQIVPQNLFCHFTYDENQKKLIWKLTESVFHRRHIQVYHACADQLSIFKPKKVLRHRGQVI